VKEKKETRMKKGLLVLFTVLLFSACDLGGGVDNGVVFYPENIGTEESFWMLNWRTYEYDRVTAVLLAETDDCMLYVEKKNGIPGVTEETARSFAEEYQLHIHAPITGAFGEIEYQSDNRKITILLADIQDFYGIDGHEDETYNMGIFNPDDLLHVSVSPYSNMREMLYIDTDPSLEKGLPVLYNATAHELQHLINCSRAYLENGGKYVDVWINEGLSTAAELIYGRSDNCAMYVTKIYNDDFYGTITAGNNFFVWNGFWENGFMMTDEGEPIYDIMSNYATAYLFFQWLRIHAANGAGIYKDIISNGAAGLTDYQAVVKAARQRIPGLSSDTDWETLLRTWMAANILQMPDGVMGYKGKVSEIAQGKAEKLTPPVFSDAVIPDGQWDWFFPGEGVYSIVSESPYTPPAGSGPNIRYAGLGEDGKIDLNGAGGYTGEVLLTFNANSNNVIIDENWVILDSVSETGFIAKGPVDALERMRQLPLSLKRSSGADKSDFPAASAGKGIERRHPVTLPPDWKRVRIGK
jgi:hypothetical protein